MDALRCRFLGLIILTGLLCHCQNTLPSADSPVKAGVRSEGESKDFKRAYKQGRKDAERDVKKGVFAIEVYGMPPPSEHQTPVHPKIQIRSVAGCVVDEQILGHAKGYNEVSQKAIQEHLGSGAATSFR
jgi:hypothetical protein